MTLIHKPLQFHLCKKSFVFLLHIDFENWNLLWAWLPIPHRLYNFSCFPPPFPFPLYFACFDHLTCLLRNLCTGQEATVRTGHRTTDWFQIGKGVHQSCVLSPCSFNLYAEYIMQNAGLEGAQAGIKISGRHINNFRYADDTTLMTESKEELKSLLMKLKKSWLKTQHSKN